MDNLPRQIVSSVRKWNERTDKEGDGTALLRSLPAIHTTAVVVIGTAQKRLRHSHDVALL